MKNEAVSLFHSTEATVHDYRDIPASAWRITLAASASSDDGMTAESSTISSATGSRSSCARCGSEVNGVTVPVLAPRLDLIERVALGPDILESFAVTV